MGDAALWIVTIFGGVFGALFGFVIIVLTGLLLALPYALMMQRSEEQQTPHLPLTSRYE